MSIKQHITSLLAVAETEHEMQDITHSILESLDRLVADESKTNLDKIREDLINIVETAFSNIHDGDTYNSLIEEVKQKRKKADKSEKARKRPRQEYEEESVDSSSYDDDGDDSEEDEHDNDDDSSEVSSSVEEDESEYEESEAETTDSGSESAFESSDEDDRCRCNKCSCNSLGWVYKFCILATFLMTGLSFAVNVMELP